jgi:serine/threonine protein kinase
MMNVEKLEADSSLQGANLINGRYQNLERIGQGTYGHVYRSLDTQTNEIVAIKKIIFHV